LRRNRAYSLRLLDPGPFSQYRQQDNNREDELARIGCVAGRECLETALARVDDAKKEKELHQFDDPRLGALDGPFSDEQDDEYVFRDAEVGRKEKEVCDLELKCERRADCAAPREGDQERGYGQA
jgi:hypothetical protein